jgi:ABC-type sulfate transport system permease subunit
MEEIVFIASYVPLRSHDISIQTGLSPLAPGQWKGFMAIYAAFFAFLNLIRPARFALTLALSKYFDRALNSIQNRFHCNKASAVGLLLSIQICFSCAYMVFGVALASMLSGVPIWAGRV